MRKEARGNGRSCKKCNIKIGSFEDCVEVDDLPYHALCDPTLKPTRAQQGIVTAEFVASLLQPKTAFRS